MHLVEPLVAGVSAAANGTVRIVRRGTSTLATYYTDFEGTASVTPTGAIALDAYGGLVAYVNETVDCLVYNSSGTLVRDFVAGTGAPAVEVRSTGFTGVDYISGVSAASSPTSLGAVLDLWKTNAGAIDWKVLVGGVATTLQTAVGNVSGYFFNVKAAAYGALGDGTTDDTSAIAAAITAAQVAGGVVFFPPGTYLVTSALSVGASVSLLGAGASASYIKMNHASNNCLTYASTTTKDWQFVRDLRIGNAQANSGSLVYASGNVKLRVDECYIGDSNTNGWCAKSDTSATQVVMLTAVTLELGGGSARALYSSGGYIVALGCSFVLPATYNTAAVESTNGLMLGFCLFGCASVTTGTFTCIIADTAVRSNTVVGCDFPNPGGSAACTAMAFSSLTDDFAEYGNRIGVGTAMTPYVSAGVSTTITRSGILLGSRDTREKAYDSDVSLTAACDQFGVVRVKRGAGYASATTLTIAAPVGPGQKCALVYHNSNAGGTTGTVTVTTVKGLASFTVNASSASVYHLLSADINGTLSWVLAGSSANFTP